MHLFLVRNAHHAAESERKWPVDDTELSCVGKVQSLKISEFFATKNISAMFSSTMLRARDTARPLEERLGLSVVERVGFNGINMGDLAGRNYEAATELLKADEDYKEMLTDPDPQKQYFQNGETLAQLAKRSGDELQRIVTGGKSRDVIVIFTHEEVIGALLCQITGMGLSKIWWWGGRSHDPMYANITHLTYDRDVWKLLHFGCTRHLEGL